MTRARILKQAQPARTAPSISLPWLRDAIEGGKRLRKRKPFRLPGRFGPNLLAAARRAITPNPADQAPIIVPPPKPVSPRMDQPAMALRKRIAVLLAIITVPAMAAPGEFGMFAAPQVAPSAPDPLALAAARALPFERPGMSFPGSAFYFLDDPPADALIALPAADPLQPGGEAGRQLGEFIRSGPAAKPFFSSGGGVSHARALECLAQAIWYEAASESEAGQRAVAQVVLNRVAHPGWPASVCGVVYQGAERRTGCQFSFTCDGSMARQAGGASWTRAQTIAAQALTGKVYEPVGHATHYHTLWVNPYWARTLDHVGTIGAHRFYRTRGAAGEKAAFTMAYAGFEPGITARGPAPEATASQFISNAAKPSATRSQAEDAISRAASPATKPSDETKREYLNAGDVRPEYAGVGQWKTDPVAGKANSQPKAAPNATAD